MLSEDALRRIGNSERALTERRVRRLYELWAHGDVEEMLAGMSADVKIATRGQWAGAGSPREGRDAVAETVRAFSSKAENIVSVLHEILIDGDRVAVHRTAVGRKRGTGRRYQCDIIDFFRFRDGLIVEFGEYPDHAWVESESQD